MVSGQRVVFKKLKTKMTRQYSAGGAVYKKLKGEGGRLKVLWLLVQPKSGDEFHSQVRWQLPKGWLKEKEKSEEAALREVREEGGVKAEIVEKIDTIKIFFKNTFEGKPKETVLKTITYYLMEYKSDVKNGFGWETEQVIWLPFAQAKEKLTFESEKKILEKAEKLLKTLSFKLL